MDYCYSYGLFNLKERYETKGIIADGGGWELKIEYVDGTPKTSTGNNAAPTKVYINNNLSGHYILKSDIDLSAYPVWIPIAAGINNYFTGMFVNPDGYVFKNLTIPFYKDFSKVGPADCKVVVDAYIME